MERVVEMQEASGMKLARSLTLKEMLKEEEEKEKKKAFPLQEGSTSSAAAETSEVRLSKATSREIQEASTSSAAREEESSLRFSKMDRHDLPELPPTLHALPSADYGLLTPKAAAELAVAAGRDVEAFDVVMRSQLTPTEGRAIVLEVGDHGLSIRDPYGALLKAVPLEYITGWKTDSERMMLTLVISKDLTNFYKMIYQTEEGLAIEEALNKVAVERVSRTSARESSRSGQEEWTPSLRNAMSSASRSLSGFFSGFNDASERKTSVSGSLSAVPVDVKEEEEAGGVPATGEESPPPGPVKHTSSWM